MQKELKSIQQAGLQLVAVSYDSEKILSSFGKKSRIAFPLLSDPDSKVIDAYGVRNQKPQRPAWDGIPHPTTMLVDQSGVIRDKLPGSVRQRHSPSQLVAAAEKMLKRE